VKKQLLLFVFAIALYIFGLYTLIRKTEPFYYFFYITSWWSYIIILDTLLSFQYKRFLVLNRYLPLLIIVSSGYWCLFELINIRLQNWFYINLPSETSYRYAGYLLGFGTVLPAIYLTQKAINAIIGGIYAGSIRIQARPVWALAIGGISLVLAIAAPRYFFPLAWVFAVLLCDGINYLCGYSSFMHDLQEGHLENLVSAILSGLLCGFLWESWNYWSLSKWVYSVPFFENIKLFEMPVAGYAGFLIFSIGTIAFIHLLDGMRTKHHRKSFLLIVLILLCSSMAFPLIDRYTVFSYIAKTKDLAFLQRDTADLLRKNRIMTSYEIDRRLLNNTERESLELLHLKGLGYGNLSLLEQKGINSIGGLSSIDEATLSTILKEKNIQRIHIYLRAARDYKKNISMSY
jgi:hypothetical protein